VVWEMRVAEKTVTAECCWAPVAALAKQALSASARGQGASLTGKANAPQARVAATTGKSTNPQTG